MRRLSIIAATVGICLAAPGVGSAVVMTATYEGTVSSARDLTGIFGSPAGGLVGLPYVARFVYDTEFGLREDEPGVERIVGGANYGQPPGVVVGSITINGITKTLSGTHNSLAAASDHFDLYAHTAQDLIPTGRYNNYLTAQVSSGAVRDLETPVFAVDRPISGFVQFRESNPLGGGFIVDTAILLNSQGRATITDGTLAPTPVPEPSFWALALLGFGLLGGAVRRSRSRALATA